MGQRHQLPVGQLPAAPDLLVPDFTVLGLTEPPVLHPAAVRGMDLPQPHPVLLGRGNSFTGSTTSPNWITPDHRALML
ncbi:MULTISPECIES: hypothetical protein [unclassified Streptomyces]|uniref:hypothetical protein n=1 Tax=unclassified Streptomyces TaxID=2593676 RepID=UPI002E19DF86|nr:MULTISPECIES: hypothetical protein [unclassified Streptomyces]